MSEDKERPRSQVNVSKHKDGYEATYTKYFDTQQEAADWGDEMQNNDNQDNQPVDTAGTAEIDADMQHDIDKGFTGQDLDQYKDLDKDTDNTTAAQRAKSDVKPVDGTQPMMSTPAKEVPSTEQPQNQPENMG